MSDYNIRPKPNSLANFALRPNISSSAKNLEVETAKSFFDFYIRSVTPDFHSGGHRIHNVCYNNLIETGKLETLLSE